MLTALGEPVQLFVPGAPPPGGATTAKELSALGEGGADTCATPPERESLILNVTGTLPGPWLDALGWDLWELNSLSQLVTEAAELLFIRCGYPVGENTGWDQANPQHQGVLLDQQQAHRPIWILFSLGPAPSKWLTRQTAYTRAYWSEREKEIAKFLGLVVSRQRRTRELLHFVW